jgi:hypothetical protein
MPGTENIQGENSKEEIVSENISQRRPIAQIKTANQTPDVAISEIKNMEAHHHPKVENKNFKEYFLEFIMIFLAQCRLYRFIIKAGAYCT